MEGLFISRITFIQDIEGLSLKDYTCSRCAGSVSLIQDTEGLFVPVSGTHS